MICGGCAHDRKLHGRRGYGACRVDRHGGLAAAVAVVSFHAARGESPPTDALTLAMQTKPCPCKRFRAIAPTPEPKP